MEAIAIRAEAIATRVEAIAVVTLSFLIHLDLELGKGAFPWNCLTSYNAFEQTHPSENVLNRGSKSL